MKVAYLLWADAFCSETDEGRDHYPQHSIGFLLQNNKKAVKLAQSYNEDGPAELLVVPRAYVRELRIVGNVKVPKPKAKSG